MKFAVGLLLAFWLSLVSSGAVNHMFNKCRGNVCMDQLEADKILKFQDASINPCDNFYRFACGNYKNPKESSENNHPLLKIDDVIQLIQTANSNHKPYQLLNDLYKTCINKNVKGQEALDLLNRVVKILGGWPVLEGEKWKESAFDWIDFTSSLKKTGYEVNPFLDWKEKQMFISNRRVLRYSVQMAQNYFYPAKTTSQKQIYSDYMLKVARIFGAKTGDVVKDMKDAFEFEEKLANMEATESNFYTEDTTVEGLQKQWPSVNWRKFVDKTLIPFVDSNEKLILTVWNSTALTKFADLINKTPKRVLANYGVWKVIQYSMPYLTKEFREEQKSFRKAMGHPEVLPEGFCVRMVRKYLLPALEFLYLDQHKSSQGQLRMMGELVKHEMIMMIKESKILTEEDKIEGTKTLADIPVAVGPSKKLSNPKELEKYYADVQVVKDNFLQTVLNLNVFRLKKKFSAKTVSEVSLYNVRYSINPGIPDMQNDQLYFPVLMIPGVFFNVNRPPAMNFGTTGVLIGMNIAQTVMHIGRNLTTVIQGEKEPPNAQLDCFRGFIDLPNLKAKDFIWRSRPEDLIAQYVGYQSARNALEIYQQQDVAELPLPGLPYSSRQLFWISWGQSMCDSYASVNDSPRNIDGGKLSDHEYLMMKILAYVPEIGEDFKCPVGSRLNPEKRCSWW